jgi:hypothetical protein
MKKNIEEEVKEEKVAKVRKIARACIKVGRMVDLK